MNRTAVKANVDDNCFDIIRLVCTFTVFLGHFLTHFQVDPPLLHSIAYFVRGVPVFFFLSGLFIPRSLERYDTGEYLRRRAVRIFPELWVCVLINLGIIMVCLRGAYSLKDILIYLATQLTAFQFYTGGWLRGYGVGVPNGALWTISVDIQFYIAAIFLSRYLKGKGIKAWNSAIAVGMLLDLALEKGANFYPEIGYSLLQCSLIPFVWIFLIGMCVYYQRDRIIPFIVRYRWAFVVAYFVWALLVPDSVRMLFSGMRYNLVTTVLLLLMVMGLGFSFRKRLRSDYSYSFYLYHMVVINFIIHNICRRFASPGTFVLVLTVSFLAIGTLAVLSHRYVAGSLTRANQRKPATGKAEH